MTDSEGIIRAVLKGAAFATFIIGIATLLMPNMDGVEFLRRTSKSLKRKHTKIIAFSNLSDSSKLDLVIELGVDKHILKSSLGPADLAAVVKQTLSE